MRRVSAHVCVSKCVMKRRETARNRHVKKSKLTTIDGGFRDALRRPRTLHLAVPGRPTHRPRTVSPSQDGFTVPGRFHRPGTPPAVPGRSGSRPSRDARQTVPGRLRRPRTAHDRLGTLVRRNVPGRPRPSRDARTVPGRSLAVPGRSSRPGTPATVPRRSDRPASRDVFRPVSDGEASCSDEGDPGRVHWRPGTPHPSRDAARRPGTPHPSGTPPVPSRDAHTVPGRASPSQDAQTVPGHAQASRTHRHDMPSHEAASWDAHVTVAVPGRQRFRPRTHVIIV